MWRRPRPPAPPVRHPPPLLNTRRCAASVTHLTHGRPLFRVTSTSHHIKSHRERRTHAKHTRDDSSEVRFDGDPRGLFFFFLAAPRSRSRAPSPRPRAASPAAPRPSRAGARRRRAPRPSRRARSGVRRGLPPPVSPRARALRGRVRLGRFARRARVCARLLAGGHLRIFCLSRAARSAALPHTPRAAAAAARTRRGASPPGVGGAGGRGRARRGRREEGARSRGGGARAGQVCSIGRGVGAVRVRVLCEQDVRTTAACVPRARTAAALARATP